MLAGAQIATALLRHSAPMSFALQNRDWTPTTTCLPVSLCEKKCPVEVVVSNPVDGVRPQTLSPVSLSPLAQTSTALRSQTAPRGTAAAGIPVAYRAVPKTLITVPQTVGAKDSGVFLSAPTGWISELYFKCLNPHWTSEPFQLGKRRFFRESLGEASRNAPLCMYIHTSKLCTVSRV
ncbi:uncharacterized protein B0H64DRAFT_392225 [Chaetomium fimeti]|uniref:Uncharacterized protein n=1 Tax=Chaetomium fimeti TaxID=1854472 RepID=A0AAE0LTR4_9PEZI|nr:hypothetical protein B0H64DRAFT_392225 [Chaetomium fimeti]